MKVLWFSRHAMDQDQLEDLKDLYGSDIEVTQVSKTVLDWKEVADTAKDFDIIAAVLPVHILADLTNPKNNQKPVIQSISKRIPIPGCYSKDGEPEFEFKHDGWYQLISAKIEMLSSSHQHHKLR